MVVKRLLKSLSLFIAIFITMALKSQDEFNHSERVINQVNKIRSEIILSKSKEKRQLEKIRNLVEQADFNWDQKVSLFKYLSDEDGLFRPSTKTVLKSMFTMKNNDFIKEIAMLSDSIKYGHQLHQIMISNKILKPEFPYKPDQVDKFIQELASYDLRDGQIVADIGAGRGDLTVLIGSIYKNMTIYATDLYKVFGYSINLFLNHSTSIDTSNKIQFVLGALKSTNLEEIHIDRIILKHTFHHVKKRKDMLKSISKSLVHGGELNITENYKTGKKKEMYCPKVLKEAKIKKELSKHGFRRKVEIDISGLHILTYALKRAPK